MAGGHGYGDDDGELRSVAGGETEERGGGRSRERGRSERGSGAAWRRGRDQGRRRQPGREEVASSAARVRARSCSHWQEEDDRRGSGDGLGRAAGPGGLPGERQVRFLSSVLFLFCFLFCRFVLNLVLKPIQFILLLTIFLGAKRIKTMLHKNISELLDLYLFNSRYKSNSNSYDLNSKSQK